jgi:hypothetical protein
MYSQKSYLYCNNLVLLVKTVQLIKIPNPTTVRLGIFLYTLHWQKDLDFANKLQRRGGHSFDVVYFSNLKVDLIDVSKSIFSYYTNSKNRVSLSTNSKKKLIILSSTKVCC